MQARTPSIPRTSVVILIGIIAVLVVLRLPIIYRQPGGHDEEYYAIPGLTILREGVPQMPHVPQRDPARVFYNADKAFFAEPPLYFYVQALFYAVLPDVYGTARLVSLLAGIGAILMVYVLARRWYGDETIALWAAGIFSLLRMFYFTAITARPDLLCTMIGLLAVAAFDRWRNSGKWLWCLCCGVLIGLGGLTHPFAIVYAVQLAGWACCAERGWRRLTVPLLLAVVAIATCTVWLPLILAYQQEFLTQFGNNIVHPAGPGIFSRIFWPFPAFVRQFEVTWERAAAIQFCSLSAGVIVATMRDGLRKDGPQRPVWFALSSIYLISMIIGQHPGFGYWSYAAAFFAMCLSSVLVQCWRWMKSSVASLTSNRPKLQTIIGVVAGAIVVGLLIPGLGLRTWRAYATHWNDVDYNAPRFAARMISDLPPDARYTVGLEYALDFYVAGRTTLVGETYDYYIDATEFPYDYLVVGRDGLANEMPQRMNGRLVRTFGRRDDPFACYAEVYVPGER